MKHLDQNHAILDAARNLTAHQKRILFLLTLGYQNKVIGGALGITENTVKAHMTQILHALSSTNRTQAALIALCLRNHIGIDDIVGLRGVVADKHILTDQQLDMDFLGGNAVHLPLGHRFDSGASTW